MQVHSLGSLRKAANEHDWDMQLYTADIYQIW